MAKKKKPGPKVIGYTKPPAHRTSKHQAPTVRAVGKKAKKQAATAAAWALLASTDKQSKGQQKKSSFAY